MESVRIKNVVGDCFLFAAEHAGSLISICGTEAVMALRMKFHITRHYWRVCVRHKSVIIKHLGRNVGVLSTRGGLVKDVF